MLELLLWSLLDTAIKYCYFMRNPERRDPHVPVAPFLNLKQCKSPRRKRVRHEVRRYARKGEQLNAVEIEEAISLLADQPFDAENFPYAFLEAFGNKETTRPARGA